jgi:hypothetical protein
MRDVKAKSGAMAVAVLTSFLTRVYLAFAAVSVCLTPCLAEVIHVPLETGVLAVPSTVKVSDGCFDLVLHLHGAKDVVEENLAVTHPKAVWVTLTLPGLSSVYRRHFENPEVFPALLAEIERALVPVFPSQTLRRRQLTVTSFSAGFGGVRELLKQPDSRSEIDALLMADSLYAGFVGEVGNRLVNPDHLRPFVAFARLAVEGKKRMLLSHTQLHTPEYASTKETADYLVEALGGQRREKRVVHGERLVEVNRYTEGKFAVLGFVGETGEDHMQHLRQIRVLLREMKRMSGAWYPSH